MFKNFEELKKKISGKVPTKVIEAELGNYAKSCGVRIIYGETIMSVECIHKLLEKNGVKIKNLIAVIGADGRRSLVRKNILPVLTREDKNYTFERLVFVTEYAKRLWAFGALR
jgi:2-polyprenyl-6-methoxyphenol hydroxylase-like FAD-dependent oxidoreductase